MSNSVCMLHTDRPATAACTECDRTLCPECTQTVAGKPVCQSCIMAIRSRVATQLNAEATAQPTDQPLSNPIPPVPYGSPGAYSSSSPSPAPAPYGAPRTDLAGNPYTPPPGSQYAPPQGAPGVNPQAPYGAQPGYGAPSTPPYGQPGYGQPQPPPAQPGYNPHGTTQQPYPPQQQSGYPNGQAPYGAPQQPYPGQNPYPVQPGRPLSAAPPAITAGNYVLGGIFGLIAAVIGGVAYVAVVLATHFSIGYMALGVGFLVGWAVKLGTRAPSHGAGIMAVVLAVLGILPCEILTYTDPSSILFTVLFLFIGCRWAYSIAASGR